MNVLIWATFTFQVQNSIFFWVWDSTECDPTILGWNVMMENPLEGDASRSAIAFGVISELSCTVHPTAKLAFLTPGIWDFFFFFLVGIIQPFLGKKDV